MRASSTSRAAIAHRLRATQLGRVGSGLRCVKAPCEPADPAISDRARQRGDAGDVAEEHPIREWSVTG